MHEVNLPGSEFFRVSALQRQPRTLWQLPHLYCGDEPEVNLSCMYAETKFSSHSQ